MIELMLIVGKSRGVIQFPDSGPGSKTLMLGTKDLGYFGEVPENQFLGRGEFLSMHPVKGDVTTPPAGHVFTWHKFMYKEKVIYLPSWHMQSNNKWNDLYNAGLVYGVDGPGTFPLNPAVNQRTAFLRPDLSDGRYYEFITRLPQGHEADPYTDATNLRNNEWTDIVNFNIGQAIPSLGTAVLTYNTFSTLVERYGYRSKTAITAWDKNTPSTGLAWVPFIELVPLGSKAIGPTNIYSIFDGDNPPYGVNADFVDLALSPSNVYATQHNQRQPQLLSFELT
uniref:Virion structural protein n=1 Tax=Pseudomonas phage RVTF4 TaxID=3236931 RepID=A0AB39CD75_9VIRU